MALGITPHGEDFDGKDAMPNDEDLKSIQGEIKKRLKMIEEKPFVEKVEKYLLTNNDYKTLTTVLAKVEEQLKKENENV